MGTNTLVPAADGTDADQTDVNQLIEAAQVDFVPRNSSGVPTTKGGNCGTPTYEWNRAHIAVGYFAPGFIESFHTYDGLLPIPAGWFPCNNTIINQTNYDAIHGAGKWAADIGSSPLEGKYAPDLIDHYTVGAASTTQDGSAPMAKVGNADHKVDSSHNHTTPNHNHKWYQEAGDDAQDQTFDSNGDTVFIPIKSKNMTTGNQYKYIDHTKGTAGAPFSVDVIDDSYTNDSAPSTNSGGSATLDIQPDSIEVIKIIRII
jgi:hypothetical protein